MSHARIFFRIIILFWLYKSWFAPQHPSLPPSRSFFAGQAWDVGHLTSQALKRICTLSDSKDVLGTFRYHHPLTVVAPLSPLSPTEYFTPIPFPFPSPQRELVISLTEKERQSFEVIEKAKEQLEESRIYLARIQVSEQLRPPWVNFPALWYRLVSPINVTGAFFSVKVDS